jgi:MraZ protein
VLFVGAFERQLDDKGRLALPATFRDRLGEHCYLAKGQDKCVTVVPASTFEAEAAAMAARVQAGEVSRNQLRALASSAILVSLDKQGRVNIDEQLRDLRRPGTRRGRHRRRQLRPARALAPQRFALVNDDGTGDLAGSAE